MRTIHDFRKEVEKHLGKLCYVDREYTKVFYVPEYTTVEYDDLEETLTVFGKAISIDKADNNVWEFGAVYFTFEPLSYSWDLDASKDYGNEKLNSWMRKTMNVSSCQHDFMPSLAGNYKWCRKCGEKI